MINWLKKNKDRIIAILWITLLVLFLLVIIILFNQIETSYLVDKLFLISFFAITSLLMISNIFVRKQIIKFIFLFLLWWVIVNDIRMQSIAQGNNLDYNFLDLFYNWDEYNGYIWSKTNIVGSLIIFNLKNLVLLKILEKYKKLNMWYFFIFISLLLVSTLLFWF